MNKISILLVITLLMAGCNKDEPNIFDSFKGTTWSGLNDKVQVEIQFTETKKCYIKGGGLTTWYNYHMTDQNSAFLEPEQYGYYSFNCSSNNNILYLKNAKTGTITYVLYKRTSHTQF